MTLQLRWIQRISSYHLCLCLQKKQAELSEEKRSLEVELQLLRKERDEGRAGELSTVDGQPPCRSLLSPW